MAIEDALAALRRRAGAAGQVGYDPGEHTVADVQAYVDAHPNERQTVLAAELAGKNRTTLTSSLEETDDP